MSRIGKKVIVLPTNVTVHFEGSKVTCKGPKGELSHEFNLMVNIYQLLDLMIQKK